MQWLLAHWWMLLGPGAAGCGGWVPSGGQGQVLGWLPASAGGPMLVLAHWWVGPSLGVIGCMGLGVHPCLLVGR